MIINPVQRKVGLMKNKTKKISKASILFYVLAVLFLLATLLFAKLTHDYISASAENSGTITLETTISIYLSNCGSYLAYSFIFYGIGMILSKFSFMTHTLADCMVEEVEEKLQISCRFLHIKMKQIQKMIISLLTQRIKQKNLQKQKTNKKLILSIIERMSFFLHILNH